MLTIVPDLGLIGFPWSPSLQTGRGHDTYMYHLLRHLSNTNWSVKVFPMLSVKGLQQGVNKFDYTTKEALFLAKMVCTQARIYHGISPLGSKTAVLANKHPLVTSIHDVIPFIHRRDIRQAYERLCIELCCSKSDKLIVSSEFTGNYLINELHVNEEKIEVVKYGVDHAFFFPKRRRSGDCKIVFSIVRWGDLERFLSAFKAVTKEVKDVKLLLGVKHSFDEWYKEQIPQLLSKYGLSKNVTLLDDIPLNKLPEYYNSADVYLSASMGGFSLTLLEAMACGTPVITFDVLDVSAYVGEEGILIKPNDFEGLAKATTMLLLNDELWKNLHEKSIKKARDFSWEKMARETIGVYQSLL